MTAGSIMIDRQDINRSGCRRTSFRPGLGCGCDRSSHLRNKVEASRCDKSEPCERPPESPPSRTIHKTHFPIPSRWNHYTLEHVIHSKVLHWASVQCCAEVVR